MDSDRGEKVWEESFRMDSLAMSGCLLGERPDRLVGVLLPRGEESLLRDLPGGESAVRLRRGEWSSFRCLELNGVDSLPLASLRLSVLFNSG